MKIAYFSPFSPDKSGISDFSEELVWELKKYCEIDLFVSKEVENQDIINEFTIRDIDEYNNESVREQYDLAVFHAGNNTRFHKKIMDMFMKYPGILEIHDLAMHHYLAEDTFVHGKNDEYVEVMKYCHGSLGETVAKAFLNGRIKAPWDHQSTVYTVNKHFVDKAKAIVVHSDYAKQMIKGMNVDAKVVNIPLHTSELVEDYNSFRESCKKELGFENQIVMGSFGYATSAKRIEQILRALGRLKKDFNNSFKYCIVGKVEDVPVDDLVKELDLVEEVVVTGYTELDEFKRYMGACDICFNLRYPTQGESSASLHRMLGMGKLIFVTDIGTFSDYPENVAFKVGYGHTEIDDIYNHLVETLGNLDALEQYRRNAYEYAVDNCCLEKNAKRYVEFFKDVLNNTFMDEEIELFLDELQRDGIYDEEVVLEKYRKSKIYKN